MDIEQAMNLREEACDLAIKIIEVLGKSRSPFVVLQALAIATDQVISKMKHDHLSHEKALKAYVQVLEREHQISKEVDGQV